MPHARRMEIDKTGDVDEAQCGGKLYNFSSFIISASEQLIYSKRTNYVNFLCGFLGLFVYVYQTDNERIRELNAFFISISCSRMQKFL